MLLARRIQRLIDHYCSQTIQPDPGPNGLVLRFDLAVDASYTATRYSGYGRQQSETQISKQDSETRASDLAVITRKLHGCLLPG